MSTKVHRRPRVHRESNIPKVKLGPNQAYSVADRKAVAFNPTSVAMVGNNHYLAKGTAPSGHTLNKFVTKAEFERLKKSGLRQV